MRAASPSSPAAAGGGSGVSTLTGRPQVAVGDWISQWNAAGAVPAGALRPAGGTPSAKPSAEPGAEPNAEPNAAPAAEPAAERGGVDPAAGWGQLVGELVPASAEPELDELDDELDAADDGPPPEVCPQVGA